MNRLFDVQDVLTRNKSNEWYTPAKYVEAARKVMGGIDLDPASCEEANRIVMATKYYSQQDNGLTKPWNANRLWMNPPYGMLDGKSLQGLFISKLEREYRQGNVKEAVLLSTLRTDASWFQSILDYIFCLADHQIMFYRPGRKPEHNIHGSMFVYFGSNEQAFIEHFSQFGRIARAIDKPKIRPINLDLWQMLTDKNTLEEESDIA